MGLLRRCSILRGVLFLQDEITREFKPVANNGVNPALFDTLNKFFQGRPQIQWRRILRFQGSKTSPRPYVGGDKSKLGLPSNNTAL